MTAQDFVKINAMLLTNSNMVMYGAKNRNERIAEICFEKFPVSHDNYIVLIGRKDDLHKIVGKMAIDIRRNDKIGFVSVRFGGEDVGAIGTTLYLGDTSEPEKIVSRELSKILKKHAHKGIIDEESNTVNEKIYWTDAVWAAGKNKYLRFKDGQFGWRPQIAP